MHDLLRRIGETSLAQAYGLAIGVVVVMLTARWLGPEGRGHIAATLGWVTASATLAHLSMGQVALHLAAVNRGTAWVGPTLASLGVYAVVATLVVWTGAAAVWAGSSAFGGIPDALLAVGFLGFPFYLWEQYSTSLLVALDRVRVLNAAQVVARTLTLIGIGVAWLLRLEVLWVVGIMMAGQTVVALGTLPTLVASAGPALRPQRDVFLQLLSGGVRLHPNYAGEVLLSTAGLLIVNRFRGAEETGLYQMALQLLTVIVILPQSASLVLQGHVGRSGVVDAWSTHRRLVPWALLAVGLLGVLSIPLVRLVVPELVGPRFLPVIPLYEVSLLVLPGLALAKLMSPQWVGRGWFARASGATVLAGLVNLGCALVWVPGHGAWGAVAALVATYALVALLQVAMVIHCERSRRAVAA